MPRHSKKKLQEKETSAPNPKKHLEYEVSQGGVVRKNTLPICPPNVTQISVFDCPHRWYKRPMIGPSIETKTGGCGAAGAGRRPRPGFQFPLKWWDSPPPSGNLEPDNQYAPSKKQRESWKACGHLRLNKSRWKFVPIKLLCKHVTNQLKPATNHLCIPYKFLWPPLLRAFWPCTTAMVAAENPGSSQ